MRIRYYIDGTVDGWRAFWGESWTSAEVAKLASRIREFVRAYVAFRWPHADFVSRIVPGTWKNSVGGVSDPDAVLCELDYMVGEARSIGALAVADGEWDASRVALHVMERCHKVEVARRTDAEGFAAALMLRDEASWADVNSAQDYIVETLDVLVAHGLVTKEDLLPFLMHQDDEVREAAILQLRRV